MIQFLFWDKTDLMEIADDFYESFMILGTEGAFDHLETII
jgi:hypothetical protein